MLYKVVIKQYGKERTVRVWAETLTDAIEKEFSVMTLPDAAAQTMATRLKVYLVAADTTCRRRIAVRANGDGTSTLTVIAGRYGFRISFR